YDGKVIFFDQTTAENPILLVTPEMIMSEIGTVIIEVGEAYQDPNVILGTVTDPSDPTTFTGIETFAVGSDWEEFTVDWSAYTGTDTYIGLMYDGPQSGFFSLNTVKMTGAGAPPVGDAWETFEDYTAGDYLVAQANSMGRDYWTTWSNSPGSAEDPMVSSDQAYAGSNSLVIEGTNDAVLLFDDITEGIWAVSFRIFVPTDYFGYFNLLQEFAGSSSQWGMQAYFDAGGIGTVDAGGAGAGTFNYSYDTWIFVEVVVDLDDDWAQMIVDGNSIVEWQWSTGSFGTGTLNQLGAMNLYAWNANGTPKAYFDDIDLQEFMMAEIFEDFETYNSGEQLVEQAVAQGIDYWTTWSNSPGSAEDPYISSDVSQSGNNSVVIEGTNDAVLLFGNKTSGAYTVFFGIYVPSGFYGYFNLLQDFAGTSSQWGAQCYFDAGGIGTIDAGGAGAGVFNYNYDEWVHVKVDVDLDTDWADIYINDALIISWQWSTGTFGTGTLNQLSAMNLWAWGDNGTPKAYFDDIALIEKTPPVAVEEITVTQQFQIYPNPATTLLNIESPEEMIGVRIMNQMGQLVFSNTQNGTKLTLNISDFERGVYFVIISTNNKQNITQKLVIN
nr:T9SS type A sorting domain-containing protein [Bacteroidota bacterium]